MATNKTAIIDIITGNFTSLFQSNGEVKDAVELANSDSQSTKRAQIAQSIQKLDDELSSILQFESFPIDNICYLRVNQTTSWSDFIHDMPSSLHSWKNCTQCEKTWNEISTLANQNGDPIIFSSSIRSYPAWSHRAVSKFKTGFRTLKHDRSSQYYNPEIVIMPKNNSYNSLPDFGKESTPGHNHIFLSSNITTTSLTSRNHSLCNKIIKDSLSILEKKLSYLDSSDNLAHYFDQATVANYGESSLKYDLFACFLKSLAVEVRQRGLDSTHTMLRPILIVKLANLMASFCCTDQQLQENMTILMKTFRARSNVFLKKPRATILFNFILYRNVKKSSFVWPENSTLKERIVACLLRNALYKERDVEITKRIMGSAKSVFHAISLFEEGAEILLNDNQSRLQILLSVLTQRQVATTIKTSVVEELMINFSENYILEDIIFPRITGYYGYTDLGDKAEIIHNAIISFTSHKI